MSITRSDLSLLKVHLIREIQSIKQKVTNEEFSDLIGWEEETIEMFETGQWDEFKPSDLAWGIELICEELEPLIYAQHQISEK